MVPHLHKEHITQQIIRVIPQHRRKFTEEGETVSAEEKQQEMQDMVNELQGLSRDDLMKTWGFALGLKAQDEHHPG